MPKKEWMKKGDGADKERIAGFSKELGISPLLAALLLNRGIRTEAEACGYLGKRLKNIHDPFLLPDMQPAVDRILTALDQKEKIVVYGDYDADGVTSTALLVHFLRSVGADVDFYIPDRMTEGYGIHILALKKIFRMKAKLMISVDCGITAVGEVELAKSMGMDVIITDHHLPGEKLPAATAVIDPKRADSEYPFDALAGVGVAFHLVLALAKSIGRSTKEVFSEYVEIAAVGTIADVVDLLDENRVIAEYGIRQLPESRHAGLRALIQEAGLAGKPLNSTSVAFMLAPRLNAVGRLAHAKDAVELLLSDQPEQAGLFAGRLEEENQKRKNVEQAIFKEAVELLEENPAWCEQRVIVLAKEGWHPGVIGIVASRILERFYRPCIMIALDETGSGKGSGRSIPGFHLFDALTASEMHLERFGGHAQAAGLSIRADEVENFRKAINQYAESHLQEEDLIPKLWYDLELGISRLTLENAKSLQLLEPFGMGNEKPVFCIRNVRIRQVSTMSEGAHLRLEIEKNGMRIQAVGFRMGALALQMTPGQTADLAFLLEVNAFRGSESVQLILQDIQFR